jgi:hypothetical protein
LRGAKSKELGPKVAISKCKDKNERERGSRIDAQRGLTEALNDQIGSHTRNCLCEVVVGIPRWVWAKVCEVIKVLSGRIPWQREIPVLIVVSWSAVEDCLLTSLCEATVG